MKLIRVRRVTKHGRITLDRRAACMGRRLEFYAEDGGDRKAYGVVMARRGNTVELADRQENIFPGDWVLVL